MRVKKSITQVPVLGYLPRETDFAIRERHLGLVAAAEKPFSDESIQRLSSAITEYVDLDRLLEEVSGCGKELVEQTIGAGAARADYRDNSDEPAGVRGESLQVDEVGRKAQLPTKSHPINLAVALDKAFCFYYEDNLDLLRECGAQIIPFSPLADEGIPIEADGVYIGGGYPELYASELAKNKKMLHSVRDWSRSGKPLYAECGGLMYLSNSVKDLSGNDFEMTGVLPFNASMRNKPVLGYREITLLEDTYLGKKGMKCRGHEFHYSEIDLSGTDYNSAQFKDVYSVIDNRGSIKKDSCGFKIDNTLASYVHIHFGSNGRLAKIMLQRIAEIMGSHS
jgi:cobyrinic acid a,c-diamide synthase